MFATPHSFAFVNRALCSRLIRLGYRLLLQPSGLAESQATTLADHPDFAGHVRQSLSGNILHVSHRWPPRLQPPQSHPWVVIQPWEFGAIPTIWLAPFRDYAEEVWVPSRFVRDCFLQAGLSAQRVHVIPNGVDPQLFQPGQEPFPLQTTASCKFLFVGGTIHRKGIDVLLEAYRRAFTRHDDVCLVVKDLGGSSFYRGQTAAQRVARFQEQPNNPALEYLDAELTDEQMACLYAACDCLVAPYRGEGFGLPIAEALACARPAIVTGHGAALDFCSHDNAYLIPACPVYSPTRRIGEWETVDYPWLAEPDRDALIDLLRHVAAHPDEAHAKGQAGAALIRSRFTPGTIPPNASTAAFGASPSTHPTHEPQCHLRPPESSGSGVPGWPHSWKKRARKGR
jgi:glycosyltransferase involved in cell wall biosynthesis